MYLLAVETIKVRWGEQITFEQSIFSEIHESKTFSTAFAFDSYLTLYLYVNGVAVSEVTDTLTHKLSTATLAAHARRGFTRKCPCDWVLFVLGPSTGGMEVSV